MKQADIVIVGSGHAGAQVAIALRQQGFSGSILMIGREAVEPYERPPLSKEYLSGDKTFERLLIRPAAFWGERGIELMLGATVTKVDPQTRELTIIRGEPVSYGTLIWATGGDPRRLSCSGAQLAGVHAVRDKSDADRLMAQLAAGNRRAVVIGGGYIGLEAAAVLIKQGCSVTLLEQQPRLLARVAGPELSDFYAAEHRAHGVDLRLATEVDCLEGDGDKVTGVKLATGEVLPADIVIVGIGIVPATGALIGAGAAGSNGVDVDEFCRTSLPGVYAIGDCAAHANPYADGAVIRLESVQNAHDMAATVARHICSEGVPYNAVPWFWSNQYDLKLQTVGLSMVYDATVQRGDPATRSFSVIYLKGGRVVALDCVNRTKDYVQGRKLVEGRIVTDPAVLADVDVPLKDLV